MKFYRKSILLVMMIIWVVTAGTALAAKKKANTNKTSKDTAADTALASSLVRAIDNCDLEAVRGLISAGASINKRSSEYQLPPFIMAFEAYKKPEESCQKVFRYIESLKPDANQIEYSGRNILFHVHTLKGFNYYIDKGAETVICECKSGFGGLSAFHLGKALGAAGL